MSQTEDPTDNGEQTRKRKAETCDSIDLLAKRSCQDDHISFKILIPSIAAGAVIGKDGKAIFQAQEETKTKVKMSKKNELYPGTTERVCIISGTRESVLKMNSYIMEKILEKPDVTVKLANQEGRFERHKQVKILVPNSTAGMIIGKNGSLINEIKQKSGAYIQLSQKPPDFNLIERCIIIGGELDQNQSAVDLVLGIIASDPQSGSCTQLTYQDINSPISSVFPTGSPYAAPCTSPLSNFPLNLNVPQNLSLSSSNLFSNFVDQNFLQSPLGSLMPTSQGNSLFNHLRTATPNSASYLATSSVMNSPNMTSQLSAMNTAPNISQNPSQKLSQAALQRLGLSQSPLSQTSVGQGQTNSYASLTGQQMTENKGQTHPNSSGYVDPFMAATLLNQALNTNNMLNSSLAQRSPLIQSSNQLNSMCLMNPSANSFGNQGLQNNVLSPILGMGQTDFNFSSLANGICCEKEIMIPESLVGIILGPQGQTIVNLQSATNTTIKISKKGVYRPGTQDRIVAITGFQPNVQRAVQLIEFNVKSEKLRRQGIIPQISPIRLEPASNETFQ